MRLRKVLLTMGTALAMLFSSTRADATDCPSAIPIPSIPVFNQAVVCGTNNDITASNVAVTCGSTNYYGGLEALYTFTPATSGAVEVSIDGGTTTNYMGLFVFDGCPTTTGTNCMGSSVTGFGYTGTLTVTVTAGTTYYLMFDTWPSPASPCPATFSIATCAAPTSPLFTSATTTDATIGWTGTSTDYEVEYGTVATLGDPGNMRAVASTNPYTITGLTAATTYYWWVRSICGPGDTSGWTAISNFTTACVTIPAPYTQDFNGGTIPACWSTSNSIGGTGATLLWMFNGLNGTPNYGAQGNGGRTIGTFAWVDASSPQTAVVTMNSPILDLSSISSPYLQFDWFHNNTDVAFTPNSNLLVEGYDGTTWVTLMDDTSNSTVWRTVALTLPASFAGVTNAQFRFSVDKTLSASGSNPYYNDILVDDFSITTAPSCLPVSGVTATNITSSSADLNWAAPSTPPAVGYEYEVRSSGAAGSGSTGLDAFGTTPAGTTSVSVSTLNSATNYTVYVRSICGPGDSSVWVAGSIFLTQCSPITTLPWTENFDGLSTTGPLPLCWTLESGSWTTSSNTFNAGPYSGTNFLQIPWSQTNAWTWSPGFTLTAGTSYDFSFWWRGDNASTWDGAVGYSSTPNSSGVTMLGTPFISSGTPASSTYQLVTYTFVPATTGDYYFGLQVNEPTGGPWYLSFDDFAVTTTPSCTAPTAVTASNVTSNSADITWTASSSGGVGYEYEVRTSGAGGSGATGLQSSGTVAFGTNNVSISSLASLTSYVVYVRTDCGSGSYSMWMPVSFLTSIDCATATPITACGASQTLTVPAGTGVYNMSTATPPGPYSTNGIETLFSFTAPLTGTYTLNVTATNSQWVDYFFKDATGGCGANGFTFIDDIFSPGTATFTLTAGVTYYILADPEGTAGATQTFDLICPATCGDPSAVTASNITTNSADISWTQAGAGTPTQWEISYGPAGTTAGSGTVVLVSSNPSTVSGLSQTTVYDVYVRAICGAGDTSVWSAVSSFTTLTSCFTPTAVTTSNVTATSVDFSWTAPATPPAFGYEYEVRTSGAAGSGATGLANSANVGAGVTTATVAGLNSATGYKIYVRSICGAGDTSAWTSATNFATVCVPPTVTSTTGATSCGAGPVTLSATGTGSTFYWYTNNTTDTVAGTGASFVTPSISATTTYYVASANTTNYSGLGNTQIPTSGSIYSAQRGIVVQTAQSFTLNSAQVYSDATTGNVDGTATLVDDATGNTIYTTPFSIPASGAQFYTMPLGWNLMAGNTYRLLAQFNSNSVRRIDAGADYNLPTFNDLGALGTIIGGYDGGISTTTYNYFHNIDATAICASARTAVTATVGGSSTTVNLGNDTTLCSGGSLTLDAGNPGATYLWSTGATTQTITVSTANTYSVSVSLPGGCSGVDTIVVDTGTAPVVNLGPNTSICAGASLTLDAGAGSSYVWSTGATTQTISVSAAGTYSVAVNNGGCTGRDTIVVSNGQPVVNLGPNASICGSVTLDAGAGGTMYMWSTGAMTQTIVVSTPDTYTVAVTNAAGCTGSDTVVISPAAPLVVALGNDTSICAGNTITLNAGNAGASYVWSNGATTQTVTVPVGTYSVTVTNNSTGCMGMDTITIGTATPPMVMLGSDTTICAGSSLTLNAGAGTSYMWNTGANTQSLVVATAGTYSVMVTNAAGCVGRDTIMVMVSPLPVVNLGNDTMLCAGSSFTLDAGNAGSTYLWSTGTNGQTISVNGPGTYSVTVTNADGCMGMDAINVMPGMLPVAGTINVTNAMPTYTFSIIGGTGMMPGNIDGWDFGDGTQDTAAMPTHTYTANGTYTVRYVVGNLCGTDTVDTTITVTNVAVNTVLLDGEVTLAPNPASDRVMIRNTSAQAMKHITVLNTVGAVVRNTTPQNGKEQSIDLSGLASATYMVRIEFEGGAIVVRKLQINP